MIGRRVALETRMLAQSLKQALHTAGRLGYDGVQIDLRDELPAAELSDTGLRQLRKMLDDLNLRVASATFPTRRGFGNPQDLDRRVEATRRALHQASRLGAATLVLTPGRLAPDDQAGWSLQTESLAALAAWSGRLGVTPALACPDEPPEHAARLLDALPEGLAGADLNPGDLILSGQSPREFVARLGPRIVHVYANDAVGALGGARAAEVQLGRGVADLPELAGLLEEFDYRGWFTVARRHARDAQQDAADAIHYLRAL